MNDRKKWLFADIIITYSKDDEHPQLLLKKIHQPERSKPIEDVTQSRSSL
jgi:hypothetical protein